MSRPPQTPSSTSLRPIGLPRPIEVRADGDGRPVALTRTGTRGRRAAETPVESVEEVWRIAEAWWREAPQARTYYRVVLADGRPLSIFYDDALGTWSEQPY
ncbi:MAG: hypothetical protein EPO16_08285 [Dehalococcoidia bacterium]|nr:MAG: hypothetical protein EPO16_08285 [Dehalococcoidia bacterium]